MADATKGEPLELIHCNSSTGKFEVGQESLAVLQALKGPVSVVAVCGRARQGKSFILNQLLQITGGFQIGSTTRPCTKGLWMWSSPQRRVDDAGREYHIVLLDSEGIDAYDQTAQYSTQIFSLAVLLSSLFVYNQMGGIDEAALDRLSLVTEMTKHIRVRANSKTSDARELSSFTPSFLWLLRDFYLRLEDEQGRQFSARDYLETALMPVSGAGSAVEAKNGIRASIKSLFPDRDCATLVRPMHEEEALVSLDQIPVEQLRPEFRQGVASLLQLIFAKAQPRPYGNLGVMSGPLLAGLTCAYVQAINQGAVPTIATAWQGVAEAECRRAAEAAEAAYAAAFSELTSSEEAALDAEHARCLAEAAAAFEDIAVGDASIRTAHQDKYIQACRSRFTQVRARKLAEAVAAVNELLLQASSSVNRALAAPDATAGQLTDLMSQFVDRYVSVAAGPAKWSKLVEFLRTTYTRITADLVNRQQNQTKSDLSRMLSELAASHKQLSAATKRLEQVELGAAAAAAAATHVQATLQAQLAEQTAELAAARVEAENKAAQASALSSQLYELQVVSEKRLLAAAAEGRAALQAERLELQAEIISLSAKLAAEARQRQELETEVTELECRLSSSSGQLAAALDANSQHLERYREAKAEAAALAQQLDQLKLSHASLEVQKQLAEQQRDEAVATVTELEAQLAAIGAEIASHMQEAEQERAKSAASSRKVLHVGPEDLSGWHQDQQQSPTSPAQEGKIKTARPGSLGAGH